MQFELTREYLDEIREMIAENNSAFIEDVIHLHPADIAEIIDELDNDEAKFIYALLNHDLQGDVLWNWKTMSVSALLKHSILTS